MPIRREFRIRCVPAPNISPNPMVSRITHVSFRCEKLNIAPIKKKTKSRNAVKPIVEGRVEVSATKIEIAAQQKMSVP
jgi:hypothetical protein